MPSVLANIAAATNQFIRHCEWSNNVYAHNRWWRQLRMV